MSVVNVVRFYRLGSTQFVLAQGLPRSGGTAYRTDESWATASGKFNDPGEASGSYVDLYDDIYRSPVLNRTAMYYAAPVWLANKTATDAVLTSKVNTALTGAGFTRPDGSIIA